MRPGLPSRFEASDHSRPQPNLNDFPIEKLVSGLDGRLIVFALHDLRRPLDVSRVRAHEIEAVLLHGNISMSAVAPSIIGGPADASVIYPTQAGQIYVMLRPHQCGQPIS